MDGEKKSSLEDETGMNIGRFECQGKTSEGHIRPVGHVGLHDVIHGTVDNGHRMRYFGPLPTTEIVAASLPFPSTSRAK